MSEYLILCAYDPELKGSDLAVKAFYLSSFYFNTRYPGDNYTVIVEAQAAKAKQFAVQLEEYFAAELERIKANETDANDIIKTMPLAAKKI